MARCLLALCVSLSLLGCASNRSNALHDDWARGSESDSPIKEAGLAQAPPPVAPAEPPPVTAVPFDARTFAQRYPNPETCEAAARQLRKSSADDGWAALRACVNGTHFTQIRSLLVPDWEEDLKARKDAATLLTKVVAARGGSINAELSLLHSRRIPLFSLEAAMAQPKTYNGRYLLVRAQVSNMRTEKGVPTVTLTEYTIGSVGSEKDVGLRHHSSKEESGSGKMRIRTDRYGKAEVSGSYSRKSSAMSHDTEVRYDNVSQETGREALGKLPKDDPFLVPGKELIILARFDGVRTVAAGEEDEDDEPHQLAVLTLYNYFEPNPAVAY